MERVHVDPGLLETSIVTADRGEGKALGDRICLPLGCALCTGTSA